MTRKKSGLTKIAALAALLLPGCVKKVTERVEVPVPGPTQQYITEVVAISEDGSISAFKTSIKDDIEATIHK